MQRIITANSDIYRNLKFLIKKFKNLTHLEKEKQNYISVCSRRYNI